MLAGKGGETYLDNEDVDEGLGGEGDAADLERVQRWDGAVVLPQAGVSKVCAIRAIKKTDLQTEDETVWASRNRVEPEPVQEHKAHTAQERRHGRRHHDEALHVSSASLPSPWQRSSQTHSILPRPERPAVSTIVQNPIAAAHAPFYPPPNVVQQQLAHKELGAVREREWVQWRAPVLMSAQYCPRS